MLPHGRTASSHPPLKLPDQASAHDLPPSCGGGVRYRSLDPTTTHLETYTQSLGAKIGRQARQSWMSSSPSGPGGGPARISLGCKPPYLEHFALGRGKAEQLELSHAIHIVDVQMRACKDKLSKKKGIKQEDPRGELNNSFSNNNSNNNNNKEEQQLDQARLLEGQLRNDLARKELQLRKLQQEEKKQTIGQNNLGANNLRTTSSLEANNLGIIGHDSIRTNSLEREDQQDKASRSEWQILIDTGAEISVAPRSFAAEVQLSNLGRNDLQLRSAEGKAINIFGWRTVQLLTQSFSFCICFAIADVETPLLGLGSLLASDLNLHIGKNLGHHLSNSLGERIQLEQRGLQLYLSACPAKLGLNLSNLGILTDNTSLMPEANLGPSNLQLEKEKWKQGGVDKSLPHRSLDQHRINPNKPAVGQQQQQALPKAKPKQKKGQGKVANKRSNWEKNDYFEKLQLELLDHLDPRASLDHNTGRHLSLRIMVILSLMNKWQLQTLRIQAACPKELTKTLRKLELTESKVDSEIMIGHKLVVVQHEDCLLISGEKMQQECFCNKLSAHYHPKEQQQLEEDAPLSFWNMLLEQNQADKAINLHPTKAFYQHLLGRYSLEDASGGETPISELDRTAPRWTSTNLDAKRSKLYKETVGELAWLSMLRPDIAFAVHRCSLSLSKPTEEHEDQLRSLLKYIAGTQTYTISLQIPRRWERAKNLELLAFSTSWVQSSKAATCVSLSFMGVHLGASIQQATSKSQAELLSVRLASTIAFHTKSLLQDLQLAKSLCFRLLTRGPVPYKLGLSKRTRHIELSSHLGQFRLSKVRPQQNLAELLANNLRACDLHRLLPKLQLQAGCVKELALPTVQSGERAFVSSSLGSFYIGQLRCALAMEKPQLVQKLSGKEFVDHLAIPKLDSTDLIQQQLSSGGANTALHNELSATSLQPESSLTDDKLEQLALTMSFQELSLQEDSLQATYLQDHPATSASEEELECTQLCTMSFQQPASLTETSLSFENQLTAYLGDELEKTALHTELGEPSSTRACALQRDAYIGSTRAMDQQLRASKPRNFLSLIRVIVILMIQILILHSLSFSFSTTSFTCTSLSFQTSFPFGWAQNLDEEDELLTTFWIRELANKAKINTTCKEENEKQKKLPTFLWEQELAELLAHKTCPLDLSDGHLGQELLWENQLQKNTLENENDKKLENKELDKKNFQSLIYKKLVALLPKKHFASAASSQLLGYEAWGKYREASEDSFDKVGDKELLQEELRREELGCKDLWPAYLWALCPDSFEETSFTEKTFANTSLGKESFKNTA